MAMGKVIRQIHWVTRDQVKENPNVIFVFGDNMSQEGLGGQAGAMRHRPNSVGVPTKWFPSMHDHAFFKDSDFHEQSIVRVRIEGAFHMLRKAIDRGIDVVIPVDGLGTGLSELPTRAPQINQYIEALIANLEVRASK